ncbi:hypothetical protein [Ancylobacter sp.]|uniref:hypothetical protein n=1 Tax=Ancylobacter sp. TaxID=1872567 RepID=UPI003D0C1BEC
MADDEIDDSKASVFPGASFSTAYADGVVNLAYNSGVFKFYLSRVDPDFGGNGDNQVTTFAQVVMNGSGFLNMLSFFNSSIEQFIKDGRLTQEQVDAARATLTS